MNYQLYFPAALKRRFFFFFFRAGLNAWTNRKEPDASKNWILFVRSVFHQHTIATDHFNQSCVLVLWSLCASCIPLSTAIVLANPLYSGHYEIHWTTRCVLDQLRISEGSLCLIRQVQNQGHWRNLIAQLPKRELSLGHSLSCFRALYCLPNIWMVKSCL